MAASLPNTPWPRAVSALKYSWMLRRVVVSVQIQASVVGGGPLHSTTVRDVTLSGVVGGMATTNGSGCSSSVSTCVFFQL